MKSYNESQYKSKLWKPKKNEDIILSKTIFNNAGFDKHFHEEFAIGVVSCGEMKAFIDGKNQIITKKSIMTINPDTAHSNSSYDNSMYLQTAINIHPSYLSKFIKENFNSKNVYFKNGLFEDKEVANEFVSLLSDYENKDLFTLDYECRLTQLISKILLANSGVYEEKQLNKHEKAIIKAKEFMQENLNFDLSLDDIIKEIDISKYHFLRLFKKHTHFSAHTYLMLKRLEYSKKLLQEGDKIAQVAHSCGFTDQSHLSKYFKKYLGFTPRTYQKFFI